MPRGQLLSYEKKVTKDSLKGNLMFSLKNPFLKFKGLIASSCGARKNYRANRQLNFFDRGANPCSLVLPQAAVAGVAPRTPYNGKSDCPFDVISVCGRRHGKNVLTALWLWVTDFPFRSVVPILKSYFPLIIPLAPCFNLSFLGFLNPFVHKRV